jgi:hypothetical protein
MTVSLLFSIHIQQIVLLAASAFAAAVTATGWRLVLMSSSLSDDDESCLALLLPVPFVGLVLGVVFAVALVVAGADLGLTF